MAGTAMRITWPCPRCDEKVLLAAHAESTGSIRDDDGNVTGAQLRAVIDDDAQPAKDHLLEAHGINVDQGDKP